MCDDPKGVSSAHILVGNTDLTNAELAKLNAATITLHPPDDEPVLTATTEVYRFRRRGECDAYIGSPISKQPVHFPNRGRGYGKKRWK